MNATESYDRTAKKYRRVYSLDSKRLCFLSVFLTEQRRLESINFDVEAADDYHYQIDSDQIPTLCDTLSCQNTEVGIAEALSKRLATWTNPIEIATFLQTAGIKYQAFHWH